MSQPEELFKDENSFKWWLSWSIFDFGKKLIICGLVILNPLAILLNYKPISEDFNGTFVNYVSLAWLGIMGTSGIGGVFGYIFGKIKQEKANKNP